MHELWVCFLFDLTKYLCYILKSSNNNIKEASNAFSFSLIENRNTNKKVNILCIEETSRHEEGEQSIFDNGQLGSENEIFICF